MNKKLLVAVVALGLLAGMTGQVGATVSTNDCFSQKDDSDCTHSVTLESNDLVVEQSDLSLEPTHECLSDDHGGDCHN